MTVTTSIELLMAVGLLVLLLAATEVGGWLAERHLAVDRKHTVDTGAIQGAMLGLLALLLGFSFGGASGRFVERQDLVVADANAISTAWLRAGMLEAEAADAVRGELNRYLDQRIRVSTERTALSPEALAATDAAHDRIWSLALAAGAPSAEHQVAVLESINAVIDTFELRVAAARKHLPEAILALLIFCSALTLLVIGYAGRLNGHRKTLLTRALAGLIALTLLATLDMDHGRIGLIQVSDAPLHRLAEQRLGDPIARAVIEP